MTGTPCTRNVLSDVFDIADYDDSGTLDEQEIKAVVRKMTRNKKATNKIVLAFRSEGTFVVFFVVC